ncbi:MAG: BTAD domain-containing putative transcriptional regulator [Pseudonocardiaceae bacterium]
MPYKLVVDFRILGPIAVQQNGQPVGIGSSRVRALLAVLLLHAGRLMPARLLIDITWREDPPSSARAQLHNMISQLRRQLNVGGQEPIVTRPGGYQLQLGDSSLDLETFRRLVARGQHAAAVGDNELTVALLTEALSLWRGPALADVATDAVAATRAALHEEKLAAVEIQLAAEVALGRHQDVLARLAVLLAEQPFRERLHEFRMLALAGTDRLADALAAYRRVCQRFADELGIEPGPRLRATAEHIARHQSGPTVDQPVPQQLPPVSPVMTGRDELLGEVVDSLRRRDGHTVPVAVLVGPGGVGKTTVAVAAAHDLRSTFPDGQLYADLRGSQDKPVDAHAVIGRFLRTLGVDGVEVPMDASERIAMYRGHLRQRRLLVVLDDAATAEHVQPLLPRAPRCGTVITSRRRLDALPDVAKWTVPVLPPADSVTLLRRLVGERVAAEPATAAAIAELCGHSPLAVCSAGARLAVRPDWTLEEFQQRLGAEWGRLDELAVGDLDVRASISLSYQALDPLLGRLFRRLGLIAAPDWPAWVAGELLGGPPIDGEPIDALLDRLADVHLIEALGRDAGGHSRYRLHDLVAAFARERVVIEDEPSTRSITSRIGDPEAAAACRREYQAILPDRGLDETCLDHRPFM